LKNAAITELRIKKGIIITMYIDKDQFKKLYEKGYSDRQIAEKMEFAIDSISNYRRRVGLPSHRKYCDYSKCMDLYLKGYSDVQIASELGISKNTVGIWRKRNGLPTQNAIQMSGIERIVEEKEDTIIKLYFEGYSDYKIGHTLNIPVNAVNKWRFRNKLPVASITSQDKITPLGEEDSLYCDTEFLEKFFNKKLKKKDYS
jgi:uncharacterized protein YjcR